ncbi:MAG TPA: hypothetical protein VEF92_06060 [Burkholderiales bacterium]|nr:hypothetical protein [Burkholderiales bacterium]
MWWLIAILAIVAAFFFPRFRNVLLILMGVLVLGFFALYEYQQAEEKASRGRIATTDVQLTETRLIVRSPGAYTLTGRLRNGSAQFSIESLQIRLTLRDCVSKNRCETIGETTQPLSVSVPPGQTRGVEERVYFSDLPSLKGNLEWDYAVVEIRAK